VQRGQAGSRCDIAAWFSIVNEMIGLQIIDQRLDLAREFGCGASFGVECAALRVAGGRAPGVSGAVVVAVGLGRVGVFAIEVRGMHSGAHAEKARAGPIRRETERPEVGCASTFA
jgi:hypothetical protein